MSFEQLLIGLFILVPLLEGLLRLWRPRTGRQLDGQPDTPSGLLPTRRLRSVVPAADGEALAKENLPPLPAVPLFVPPRPDGPARVNTRERLRAGAPRSGVSGGPQRVRGHEEPSVSGLRHAIVLMTIFGSCRSLEPGDEPHSPSSG